MNDQIAAYLTTLLGSLTLAMIAWIAYLTRRLSRLEVHLPETYVSKADLSGMRSEITESMGEVQRDMKEIRSLLHELKGAVGSLAK